MFANEIEVGFILVIMDIHIIQKYNERSVH